MDIIAVSHYVDPSFYPLVRRTGGHGDDPRVQRVYWECIAVLAASARRWSNSGTRFEVYTNTEPPADIGETLDAFDVTLVQLPVRYVVPPGFTDNYVACFYRFDLVEHFASTLGPDDRAVIIDSDCLFVDRPGRLFERVRRDGLMAHTIDYAPDVRRHGRTRADLARLIGEDTGQRPDRPPTWIGGELIGVTGASAATLVGNIRQFWEHSLARFHDGRDHLKSDEHLWTMVFWHLGWSQGNAGDLLKRLYTSTRPLPRNVSAEPAEHEMQLALWHLPGEKERGLRRLAAECRTPGSPLLDLDDDAYRQHVGRAVGLIRTPERWLGDQLARAGRVPYRIRSRLVPSGRRR